MRFKKDRQPQPICATENIPLFVMYIRKELTIEQELKLDKHLLNCEDCKTNFAYTEEILQFKQVLTIDEKTLLLRYIADPLWYYSLHSLKKQILKELKETNQASNITNTTDNQSSTQSDEKAGLKTTSSISKHRLKSNDRLYRYLTLGLCVATFLSLASTVILLTKTKYPDFLSFSSNTKGSYSSNFNNPINLISASASTVTDNNLYQQLDTAIDDFLSTQNKQHLAKAQSIATDIDSKYQDKYGVDLVSYYQTATLEQLNQLSIYRKQLFALINSTSGNNYDQRVKDSEKLEQQYIKTGNIIEAYRLKIILNKLYVVTHSYEQALPINKDGLTFSIAHKYLFLQGYFLLWQGNLLSETTSIEISKPVFEKTILIGEKIQVDELTSRAKMSLATIYHLNNYDKESLEITQNLLAHPEKLKKDRVISLMQLAGLTSSKLKNYNLSTFYLKETIKLSEEINNLALSSRSYVFLSLIAAETKNFSQSEIYYLKAINTANKLTDDNSKLTALILAVGYYGKTKLLEGNFDQAAKAYQESLAMSQQLKLTNNLQMSQLNEGLAIALKELNNPYQATNYLASASHYRKEAQKKNEIVNCFLSFIPTPCQTN